MVSDLLGDAPLPLGTNQLFAQFSLLPLRPGQKLHHPLAAREFDRHRFQRVKPTPQFGDLRLGLTEHDEQQRGDRQGVMGILMHEVPTRAYRSIERGKSRFQRVLRTGQELSVATGTKRKITPVEAATANRLFCLYTAKPGTTELPQTIT
ncbi:hypothetical protein [Streptomyces sp. NBC_00564]|uniref:hypothetical protein n=1 Tax=Streptomyces sp. NBC_00564 TaxID=2903663 RepID=UPI00352DFA2F|nr:hypothetical protein OG256_35935 [Streptomyces sp. NBC_00564]